MFKKTRQYLKNYINQKYPDWDISIALRYIPIVDDLKKNCKKDEEILEVGSEITGITPYLQRKVTGVDMDFDYSRKNEFLTPVKGSATSLPFGDESFDYVLSVDMLEHLSPNDRKKAIEEILRVARKKLYLSFPCGKVAEKADKNLYNYYLRKRGEEYPYLKEHIQLGLPDYREVEKQLLEAKGWKVKIKNNTNIWLWVQLLKWGLSGKRLQSSLYRRLLLLLPILKHFNFGETYRKLFILERV